MDPDRLLDVFHHVVDDVGRALATIDDWGPSGVRDGQYRADLVADRMVLDVLRSLPVGILSEESGAENLERDLVIVVDPLDGSTNASRGIRHFATSLCAVDADGPVVSLVAHQALPLRWWAVRGGGAWRNGVRMDEPPTRAWSDAIVGVSGPVPPDPGWAQYRALGASAIDLCLVADGTLDAFIDCSPNAHGVWDYSGAMLVCREVGVEVRDAQGRELAVLDHSARRTPVAAHGSQIDRALEVRATLP